MEWKFHSQRHSNSIVFDIWKQRDEMQIRKMIDRKKCTEKEKMMAKKEILFLDRKEAPYTNMV